MATPGLSESLDSCSTSFYYSPLPPPTDLLCRLLHLSPSLIPASVHGFFQFKLKSFYLLIYIFLLLKNFLPKKNYKKLNSYLFFFETIIKNLIWQSFQKQNPTKPQSSTIGATSKTFPRIQDQNHDNIYRVSF